MSVEKLLGLIKKNDAKFVDLRYSDTRGKQHHATIPARIVEEDPEDWLEQGQPFDGSSIEGWKGIQASDMLLIPEIETAFLDPFFDDPTVAIICNVIDPVSGQGYGRDPRSIARRAENYLKATNLSLIHI